ncbi:hypothetical protein DITRI_Ditri19aG0093200 [Diplodiscus trichospermus]
MATFLITNNCPYTIWPATLTGSDRDQLPTTGFELVSRASNSINVPPPWKGRVWARTRCSNSSGRFRCATADCSSGEVACGGAAGDPPATFAEFILAENRGQDFFDISLVDGFNLPASITLQGGSGTNCSGTSCAAKVNSVCPSNMAVRGSGGNTVACKSPCLAFNQPRYCCTGEFDSPQRCQPTNYSIIFKNQCPEAYSYVYDDPTNTYSCTGGPDYVITFCP